MTRPFDYFVILAEMRTGSNFLESNLDAFPGLKCYGEAFNPHFIVGPSRRDLFGITQAERDADPARLIRAMQEHTDGLPGFRYFHDHDPRIFDMVMGDRRCAKIVLTRNVVESYVSHRIAQATNQWRLGDMKNVKSARIRFEPEGFERMLLARKGFQERILRALQTSGQTAFYLDYEDIQNLDVINGLARFLGEEHRLDALSGKTKKQNPEPLAEKVTNFAEMQQALAKIDHFDLGRLPNFEPRRRPMVPAYLAGDKVPLLFMPVPGGPDGRLRAWLAAAEGVTPEAVKGGFTQKTLRQWKRARPGHRSFTVISHPAERLHRAFCRHILADGPAPYPEIRRVLKKVYELPLPEPGGDYDLAAHRRAFLAFARWVRGNLNGQTSVRVDASWASQSAVIQGFAEFMLPDRILREEELEGELIALAREVGVAAPPLPAPEPEAPFALADFHDDEVEKAVRGAYQRDYMLFGFAPYGR